MEKNVRIPFVSRYTAVYILIFGSLNMEPCFFFSLGFYDFFSKAIFTHMKYYFKTSVSPSKAIFRRIEGVDTAEMLILIFYSLVSPLSRVKCNAERFPSGNPPHNVAHEWPNQEAATKLL